MSSSHYKILRRISELNQRVDLIQLEINTVCENTNQILKVLKELQHELLELMENQCQNFEGDDE
jgi:chaperonin cofactor prefoldin